MSPPSKRALRAGGVVAFTSVCGVLFFVLYGLAGGKVGFDKPYRVQAVVPTAVALVEHADVRSAGVKIGEVEGIARRGGNAVLMLSLDEGHAPVYRDATVRVRTKTLVGENYVDLLRGSPATGDVRDGGVLPIDNALDAVQLDEILSVFDAPTRRRLRAGLSGLGSGLGGSGSELNASFEATAAVVSEGGTVAEVLGQERQAVAGLLDDGARVMQALADRGAALRVLARRGRATARAVSGRARALRATLRELPATLTQTRSATRRLGALSLVAAPVLDDLAGALDELVPVTRRLPAAARRARDAVTQLGPFSRASPPMLSALARFAPPAVGALPRVNAALRQLRPILAYLEPYDSELGAFFANLRSGTNTRDATGNMFRVFAIISRSAYASFTPEMRAAFEAMRDLGLSAVANPQGTNAYPAPGRIGDPGPAAKDYPRVPADTAP